MPAPFTNGRATIYEIYGIRFFPSYKHETHIFFKEGDDFWEARLVGIRNIDKCRYYSFIRRAILMHFGIVKYEHTISRLIQHLVLE
jgi:hypothetical protein